MSRIREGCNMFCRSNYYIYNLFFIHFFTELLLLFLLTEKSTRWRLFALMWPKARLISTRRKGTLVFVVTATKPSVQNTTRKTTLTRIQLGRVKFTLPVRLREIADEPSEKITNVSLSDCSLIVKECANRGASKVLTVPDTMVNGYISLFHRLFPRRHASMSEFAR